MDKFHIKQKYGFFICNIIFDSKRVQNLSFKVSLILQSDQSWHFRKRKFLVNEQ